MEFSPLIKGTPDWNEKYNQDIGGLCAEMNAARSSGILNTYVHTKNGTAHTLAGEGAIMRFTATAGWAAGDTISVNGLGKNPVTLEGTALPAGAFAQGTQVVAVVDGENLQFLTQSYAGQFDAISTQMSNKVNYLVPTNPIFDFNEPGLGYGIYRLANAYIQEMLNAPQAELAEIGRGTLLYFQGSNPMWEQQVFLDQYAGVASHGHIYARTAQDRKGKVWYPWVKLATCACADMEWKELSTTDRFIYRNDDKSLRLQYRKGYDAIYVAGVIKPAEGVTLAYDELIATLPAGYRPSRLWYQLCALSGGGYFCRIRVDKGGGIVISGYDPDGADAIKNSIEIYLTIPL